MSNITGIEVPGLLPPPEHGPRAAMPRIKVPPLFDPPLIVGSLEGFTPMENQGATSKCVSFAETELQEHARWQDEGRPVDLDPDPHYALCKQIDGIPHQPGTYPWAAVAASRKLGWIKPEDEVFAVESIEEIQRALHQGMLVSVGYKTDAAWGSDMVRRHGRIADGAFKFWGLHQTVCGVITPADVYILNSWGRDWCYDGAAPMSHARHKATCVGGYAWKRARG